MRDEGLVWFGGAWFGLFARVCVCVGVCVYVCVCVCLVLLVVS